MTELKKLVNATGNLDSNNPQINEGQLRLLLNKVNEQGILTSAVLNSLLYRAISLSNSQCVKELLEWLPTLDGNVSSCNVIHRYLLHIGTHHASSKDAEALILLLDSMTTQKDALLVADSRGCTPLHFAAQFGLASHLRVILSYLMKWGYLPLPLDSELYRNSDEMTPVHLAVIGGHAECVDILCEYSPTLTDSSLLIAAVRLNHPYITTKLLDTGLDCTYKDKEGETALYICARVNHIETLKILLAKDTLAVNIVESSRGWTPLFVAAAQGHMEIVSILMEYSDLTHTDNQGWTAHENACFRGHIDVTNKIMTKLSEKKIKPIDTYTALSCGYTSSQPSKIQVIDENPVHLHKTLVMISLGSTDLRDNKPGVTLKVEQFSEFDIPLMLVVKATGVNEFSSYTQELPIEAHSTESFRFYTDDISKVTLIFDLMPTHETDTHLSKNALARAVADVSDLDPLKASNRHCLRDVRQIPLISRSTFDVIGNVRFRCLIVTPFYHPKMKVRSIEYWNSLPTRVIGHRGLGKNTLRAKGSVPYLQMGENTLESFILAAQLGASHVEFDVQLTKDHVPVIYHDFIVSEAGIDVPMHALTAEQFFELQTSAKYHYSGLPKRSKSFDGCGMKRYQTFSVTEGLSGLDGDKSAGCESLHLQEPDHITHRMKYTRDFKLKGFKGNSRGHSIQAPFTTLMDVLKALPPNVGCNIECKYPMLHEGEDEEMDEYAIDLNIWVDKVLECVFEYGSNREIIFSSFHPDICLMLNYKQGGIPFNGHLSPVGYPTLFLTEGGVSPMWDIRASSLQEAIRFVSSWSLLGIVSECTPFVLCPRLINVIKRAGLVCVSYGTLNNDPKLAREQVKHGVDAVIVDHVRAVHTGLSEKE